MISIVPTCTGGGLPWGHSPSPEDQKTRKLKQLNEFVQFFKETHMKQNIAVFCGDFNMHYSDFSTKMDDLNLDFIGGDDGGTVSSRGSEKNDEERFTDICHALPDKPIYCTLPFIGAGKESFWDPYTIPKSVPSRIDYILVESPTSDHSFMLDVSYLRRRLFPRSNPTEGEYYLSDHLGLDVIFIPSKKPNTIPNEESQAHRQINQDSYLTDGNGLISDNGKFFAWLYDDGQLCIKKGVWKDHNAPDVWKSGKKSDEAYRGQPHFLMLYSNGSLCIERGNAPYSYKTLWCSGGKGTGQFYAKLDNDGKLRVYSGDKVKWHS